MKQTIWKYLLPVADEYILMAPANAQWLPHVQPLGNGMVNLWALVQPDNPQWEYRFRVYGTGHPVDEVGTYLGTAVTELGLVWHVFRVGTCGTD